MNAENPADHISRGKKTIKPDELQQAIEQAAAILKAAGADAVYLFGSTVEGPVRELSALAAVLHSFYTGVGNVRRIINREGASRSMLQGFP